jgi:hypothetical protein
MGGVEMQWNRSISYTSHTNHSHNLKLQEYCQLFFMNNSGLVKAQTKVNLCPKPAPHKNDVAPQH